MIRAHVLVDHGHKRCRCLVGWRCCSDIEGFHQSCWEVVSGGLVRSIELVGVDVPKMMFMSGRVEPAHTAATVETARSKRSVGVA
jgi:hypothetical protein